MEKYVLSCFGVPSDVKLDDFVINPNNVIIPDNHLVATFGRKSDTQCYFDIVLKSDPADPIWY